jgi:MATE family multidrug resistance protein
MSILNTSNFSAFSHEAKNLIKLAIPIFIGQFCMTALGFIDTIMAADVGTTDLAAIALGTTFWTPVILLGTGLTIALSPIVAQLNGSKQSNLIPKVVYNSVLPGLIIAIISMSFLIIAPDFLLSFMDKSEPLLKKLTVEYLFYIALGIPGCILFNILKNSTEGLSIAKPSMVIGFLTLLINIPINYIFIYGKLGIPPMGAVGCGVATSIVMWISFFMIFGYSCYSKKLKHFKLLLQRHTFEKETIKRICFIGLPIAFSIVIETCTYSIVGYALTPYGATTIAAHQIANIVCILAFMIPLSIASAIAIRTGHSIGEGSAPRAKRAALSGLGISLITILPLALITFFYKHEIVSIFSTDPNVVPIAINLFIFILIYQLQDSFFGTALGILRGFKDTMFLLLANLVILWIIGIPLCLTLGLTDFFGKCYGIYGMWGVLVGCYYLMTLSFIARSFYLHKNINKYINNNKKI